MPRENLCKKETLKKGWPTKKGGPRHFAKPWVEAGLLFDLLSKHEDLMKNFKTYGVNFIPRSY